MSAIEFDVNIYDTIRENIINDSSDGQLMESILSFWRVSMNLQQYDISLIIGFILIMSFICVIMQNMNIQIFGNML